MLLTEMIMSIWIIIGIIGVVAFILWVKNTSRPDVFARDIAKTQLIALRRTKERNPKLRSEKLYATAIATRPGYSIEDARELVKRAKETKIDSARLRFRDVVGSLVIAEYEKYTGNTSMPTVEEAGKFAAMKIMVDEVIPPNL